MCEIGLRLSVAHGHDIVQAATRPLQNTVNLSKHLFDLSFEIVCDVVALAVLGCGLTGHPQNRSTRRNDTRRKRTSISKIASTRVALPFDSPGS